jgi:hypothetical protein
MTTDRQPPTQPNENAEQLDSIAALDAIWSKVATFTLTWWIYWFIFEISGEPIGGSITAFRKHNDGGPLFALGLGNLLTLISLSLLAWRVKEAPAPTRLDRVPPLWLNVRLTSRIGKVWKWFTIVAGIVLPIAFEGYFWVRFRTRQAWANNGTSTTKPTPWGLWSYVSPSHLIVNSNDFRYGRISSWNIDSSSASFIPFWEPLIGAVLSALTVVVVYLLVQRLVAPPTFVPSAKRRRSRQRS